MTKSQCSLPCVLDLAVVAGLIVAMAMSVVADDDLVGHWPLTKDGRDSSVNGLHAQVLGAKFTDEGASFDGRGDHLLVPASPRLALGTDDFTISVRLYTAAALDDALGDIVSCYDPASRNGFLLHFMNYSGVTSAQSNWRNLAFGIDDAEPSAAWIDCGRPGTTRYIKSLTVFRGDLYAGTWEPGNGEPGSKSRGHVYKYAGGKQWIDCGAPDPANAMNALAVFQGRLYAGSETYSGGGSALPLSPNDSHGGRVYRYEGGTSWTDVGKVADVRSISGLAVYNGKLYAGTGTTGAWRDKPRTRGMYRYDGNGKWTSCGCPGDRITHLAVYNGDLFGLSYDDGGFFRYDGGQNWTQFGPVPNTTQVYSTAIYQGRIHAGTWPTGSVYRMDGPNNWKSTGRLGEEREVMGMAVYNGKLFAGTLPSAEVYRFDGDDEWVSTGQLDKTPDVVYRRAWVTAVYDGQLFCGTLPSGHVFRYEAGRNVTYDREVSPGWHHLAAIRSGNRLTLSIDGKQVAARSFDKSAALDLHGNVPLKIGAGQHDYFLGKMRDLRIHRRALSVEEIKELAAD